MITKKEMKNFVSERIKLIEDRGIKKNLLDKNGLLINIIPENRIDQNLINWKDENHQFTIKHAFRRLSDLTTIYEDKGTEILGYTPDREYFICFQNGIIETYRHPLEVQNNLNRNYDYIKVDNIFYQVRDTLEAFKTMHQKTYKLIPPYYIFITFLGVKGTYFYSLDKKYYTDIPFPTKNARFEPFGWNDLINDVMPKIISGVNYGIRHIAVWK